MTFLLSTRGIRLGKSIGRIGFVYGLFGSVLFYTSPWSPLYESHVVCPACPYVEVPFVTKLGWLEIGLRLGLIFGVAYALSGFAIGYCFSKLLHWR
jgi:hypothetical protein